MKLSVTEPGARDQSGNLRPEAPLHWALGPPRGSGSCWGQLTNFYPTPGDPVSIPPRFLHYAIFEIWRSRGQRVFQLWNELAVGFYEPLVFPVSS